MNRSIYLVFVLILLKLSCNSHRVLHYSDNRLYRWNMCFICTLTNSMSNLKYKICPGLLMKISAALPQAAKFSTQSQHFHLSSRQMKHWSSADMVSTPSCHIINVNGLHIGEIPLTNVHEGVGLVYNNFWRQCRRRGESILAFRSCVNFWRVEK